MDTVDVHAEALAHIASNAADIGHQVEALLRPVQTLHFTAPGATTAPPVRAVAWHPTRPGVVAFAAAHAPVVDARLAQSQVIVWDLVDLLRPRAILQAPDLVTSLCWAAGHDQVLVAGLAGGQLCAFEVRGDAVCTLATLLGLGDGTIAVPKDVVFEDEAVDMEEEANANANANAITDNSTTTTTTTTTTSTSTGTSTSTRDKARAEASAAELGLSYPPLAPRALCPALPHPHAVTTETEAAARGEEPPSDASAASETNNTLVPLLPVCVSAPEHAHSLAVTALQALPAQIELNRRGELVRDRDTGRGSSSVFLSAGGDGQLLYWDLAALEPDAHATEQAAAALAERLAAQRAAAGGDDADAAGQGRDADKDTGSASRDADKDSGRPRWRDKLKRAEPEPEASADDAAPAPEPASEPVLYADTTPQALHVLARLAPAWTPFHRQALVMPGGAPLRAVSVALSSDLSVCVGGEGGEAAVGAAVKPNGFRTSSGVVPRGPWEVAVTQIGDGKHARAGTAEHSALLQLNGGLDSESDGEGPDDGEEDDTEADDPTVFSAEEAASLIPALSRVVPLMPVAAHVRASPFYSDLFLVRGEWTFTLWQRDCPFPLFTSPPASAALTAAEWSPSRPSVIIVASADGAVRLWDLLDSCSTPHTTHVASSPLLSLATWSTRASAADSDGDHVSTAALTAECACTSPSVQLLAAGDAAGRLHILEVSAAARACSRSDVLLFRRALRRELRRVRVQTERGVRVGQLGPRDLGRVLMQLETASKPVVGPGPGEEPGEEDRREEEEAAEAAYQATLKAWRAKLAAMEAEED
jgi:hypothetical protein